MPKFVIVAETGADIPADLAEEYSIYIAPMHVTFDQDTRDDGTFPITEVFDFYKRTKILPRTSGCNPEDFTKLFDRVHAEHPESQIIYLAYSACTTCSYQSAVIATEDRDYITFFDTKHVSAGQCLVVISVARFIQAHPEASVDEILFAAEKIRSQCRMGFFPGDLDYLRAGGRVSNAAYIGARLLSLNPLIEIIDGKLIGTQKYRGKMTRVAPKLLNEFAEKEKLSRDILFFAYSAGFPENSIEEITRQAKDMGFREIRWVQTGSVVSTHSGPGAFGVCGLSEK